MWPFGGSQAPDVEHARPHTSIKSENALRSQLLSDSDRDQPTDSIFGHSGERLGIPSPIRAPIIASVSFITAFGLGATRGGQIAADRYAAENAHRLPVSRSGWYLYHKSKNYHRVVGSMREGVKYGLVVASWATLFGITEEAIDRARGKFITSKDEDDESVHKHRDVLSTVMAGFTVSGIYSWKQGFDRYAAARMGKVSFKFSLAYGLAQDVVASLRGEKPGYMEWLLRNIVPSSSVESVS